MDFWGTLQICQPKSIEIVKFQLRDGVDHKNFPYQKKEGSNKYLWRKSFRSFLLIRQSNGFYHFKSHGLSFRYMKENWLLFVYRLIRVKMSPKTTS